MNITLFNITKNIFKTLPIGYYLGRRISYKLSEDADTSYFDPARDIVVVAYRNIECVVTNANIDLHNTNAIERAIRAELYHEISHVILTPICIFDHKSITEPLNIVEDERIETINANVFLDTNFKEELIQLTGFKGQAPTDARQAFFQLVRFHIGDKKWIVRLTKILEKYSDLNALSDWYKDNVDNYIDDINDFYREFVNDFNQNQQNQQNDQQNQDNNSNNNQSLSNNSQPNNEENNNEENNDESNNCSTNAQINTEITADNNSDNTESQLNNKEDNSDTNDSSNNKMNIPKEIAENIAENNELFDIIRPNNLEDFRRTAKNVLNRFYDASILNKFQLIVEKKLRANKDTGAAINAYSGKFDVRAVAKRDDYKWWSQQNREGHIRHYSNVHFNLFLDNSSSFSANETKMNQVIKALDKLDKKYNNFTFDVITINTKIEEWKDHNRIFETYGGTSLGNDIAPVIKRHTKTRTNNYNIVLFDGDAHCYDYNCRTLEERRNTGTNKDAFCHFNTSNTVIVSDEQNKKYIEVACPKAKTKITENYCDVFVDILCDLLEKVI